MKTVFISHSSADKPFVFRLAFELLAEGVPVWLDTWELGPGDPLIARLDSALDGRSHELAFRGPCRRRKWTWPPASPATTSRLFRKRQQHAGVSQVNVASATPV